MSAEAITHALLSVAPAVVDLVGAQVFPEVLPDNEPAPALVHAIVVGVEVGVIGADQYRGCQRARMELEGYADDFATAKAIYTAALKAMRFQRGQVAGVELVAVLPGPVGPNGWDPIRSLFVCTGQVFVIWSYT